MTLLLEEYQQEERAISMRDARNGLIVHAAITVILWAVLIPINIFVASEFPWSLFVVGGSGIGLFFHWFGYRHVEDDIRRHQALIEGRIRSRGIRDS